MITEKDNVFYCDCGFSFERGRSGAHSCETGLRKKIAESEAQLTALAAENAGLKAGITYFAYSPDYGFDYFKDKQSAIDTAQDEIDAYREDAEDGWSEDVQRVSWGVVVQQAQGVDAQGLQTSDSQHTYQTCDYRLVDAVETPATDAFLAEVRAQGVEMFAAHKRERQQALRSRSMRMSEEAAGMAADAENFADELRKGVQS